jgi:hypothetical protein
LPQSRYRSSAPVFLQPKERSKEVRGQSPQSQNFSEMFPINLGPESLGIVVTVPKSKGITNATVFALEGNCLKVCDRRQAASTGS